VKLRDATAKACLEHGATHAFSAFGIGSNTSTISKEQHRAVDVEGNRAFALGCADSSLVTTFVLLSSVNADIAADEDGSGASTGRKV
jgi:hypothetical protein